MFELLFFTIAILFFIGSIDDFILDSVHAFYGLTPKRVSESQWKEWRGLPEKTLAIMIPAWKESSVLEAMVKTNLARIKYKNYKWFIGVYPNDLETLTIARDLEKRYPEKVIVVVTDRAGPTSKAHCLNCIMRVIQGMTAVATNEGSGWIPHYIAIHDAEDVIHPEAFTAINAQSADLDFIQLPIFSLPVPVREWVSGTYLDEFAEIHLREIPVRKALTMPIPSAGVGTFFSHRILMQMGKRFGYWFDEGNLTEDYEISLRIARLGGRQDFLLYLDQENDFVATREYFPSELGRSIRQKTRWTTGIGLQTMAKWGSYGSFSGNFFKNKNWLTAYALFRDRKALWANPSVMLAWFLIAISTLALFARSSAFQLSHTNLLMALIILNTCLFAFRLFQRARFCAQVYGPAHGILSVPRVLLSGVINGSACMKALHQFFFARMKNSESKIEWDKTDHRFPVIETAESQEQSLS